jgi:Spy/CpxP family protein refolding chaperone
MKSFNQKLLIAGLVLAGLAAAGTQLAVASPGEYGRCEGRGGHERMGGGMHDEDHFVRHLERRLDLSAEQRTAVRKVVDQSQAQRRALHDKLNANRVALHALTESGKADDKQLQKLADEHGKLMAEMIVQRSKVHSEIQKVLTSEQREQLKEMRDRRRHRENG